MSSYWEPCLTAAQAQALTQLANGSAKAEITLPDDLAGITALSSGAANTYGAWVTVVAANILASHALTKVSFQPNTNGNMKYQIGTGAAGSEVPLRDFAVQALGTGAGGPLSVDQEIVLAIPALIPANARVAVRIKVNPANVANGGFFWLGFLPRPF